MAVSMKYENIGCDDAPSDNVARHRWITEQTTTENGSFFARLSRLIGTAILIRHLTKERTCRRPKIAMTDGGAPSWRIDMTDVLHKRLRARERAPSTHTNVTSRVCVYVRTHVCTSHVNVHKHAYLAYISAHSCVRQLRESDKYSRAKLSVFDIRRDLRPRRVGRETHISTC